MTRKADGGVPRPNLENWAKRQNCSFISNIGSPESTPIGISKYEVSGGMMCILTQSLHTQFLVENNFPVRSLADAAFTRETRWLQQMVTLAYHRGERSPFGDVLPTRMPQSNCEVTRLFLARAPSSRKPGGRWKPRTHVH